MSENYRIERWKEEQIPDAEHLKTQMESEGYYVYRWSDAPGAVYGAHEHGEDQSHWIIRGKLELTVEGCGTFVLAPGDRDFMPAGTRHSARVASEESVVYLIGEKLK